MHPHKLLQKALASPANFRFEDACALARAFGFHLSRVKGSHHIFVHPSVRELLNYRMCEARPSLTKSGSCFS